MYRAADQLIESKTKRGKKRAPAQINSIIIHTTGYGAGLSRIAKNCKGDLDCMGKAYAYRMAKILKYKGHFLVDYVGKVWQFLPVTEVAWHTGGRKKKSLIKKKPPKWWRDRWEGIVDRPTDLPSWQGGSPNQNSVGIDLLAHGNGQIHGIGYTDSQICNLRVLVKELCSDYAIPFDRKHVVGHEDLDWISRNGWDPGKYFNWDDFFEG